MNAAIQDAEKRSPYPVAPSGVNEVIQVNAVSAVK
jgi:hypothetical protein